MSAKFSLWLVIGFILSASLSACTTSNSECRQDSDCSVGQYCASGGGGVFFEGGICADKNRAPNNDSLDASNDDTNSDDASTSSDVQPDTNNDADPQDSDDIDATQPEECVSVEQCNPPSEGMWDECKFELPCDTNGVQKREVRTAACENNVCIRNTTTEEQVCTRETDNNSCGQSTSGDWSECSFDGNKTRQVFSPTCSDSVCSTAVIVEEVRCHCTDNASCGDVIYGQWQSCSFANTCASSGTQTREVKTPTCSSSSCSIVVSQQQQACTRPSTTGQSCGTVTNSQWSICSYSTTCANSGTHSRTKTTPTCQEGTCNGINSNETEACGTRNTNDTACGAPTQIQVGHCDYADVCDIRGQPTPNRYNVPACLAGTCSGQRIDDLYPDCTRNTAGVTCRIDGFRTKCEDGCCGPCLQ